jgi:phosphate-selective porin OprO/OprP
MTTLRRVLLGAGAALALAAPAMAAGRTAGQIADQTAAPDDARLSALEQQLHDVQRQLAQIRRGQAPAPPPAAGTLVTAAQLDEARRRDSRRTDALEKRLDGQPKVSLTNGRFTIASRDGAFSLSLRSLVQFDAGYFSQGRGPAGVDLNSGTNFRRAQVGFTGTAWRDWSYNFTYDFGGNGVEKNGYVYTASLQYDFAPFAVRVGAFAPFAGLDDSTGSGDLIFLERASAADIARGIAGSPGREGINIYAHGARYLVSLALTGNKSTESYYDEQQAVVGRAAWLAVDGSQVKWLLDVDMTHVFKLADVAAGPASPNTITLGNGPELAIDKFKTVSTGAIDADALTELGAETAVQSGRFYGQGGYFHYAVDRRTALPDPDFSGWYALAAFSLTGEPRRYDAGKASFAGLKPDHPLGKDGLGAWEAAVRYSTVDLGYAPLLAGSAGGVAGGEQTVWSVALNWYPTAGLRFMLDYSNLRVDHVEAPGKDITASAVGLRSQIAF